MSGSRSWVWRRKRSEAFGWWEDLKTGERVGPIPLDGEGRAAFVPSWPDADAQRRAYYAEDDEGSGGTDGS